MHHCYRSVVTEKGFATSSCSACLLLFFSHIWLHDSASSYPHPHPHPHPSFLCTHVRTRSRHRAFSQSVLVLVNTACAPRIAYKVPSLSPSYWNRAALFSRFGGLPTTTVCRVCTRVGEAFPFGCFEYFMLPARSTCKRRPLSL